MAPRGRPPKPPPIPCPGIDAPLAPGAHGAWSASGIGGGGGPLPPKKLARMLRTFDNAREAALLAPYARSADEWLSATTAQLTAALGGAGPAEMAILANASLQLMWSRRLFDKAAAAEDARLVETASRLAEAVGRNIRAAFDLRRELRATEDAPDDDPLAAYRRPVPEFEPDEQTNKPTRNKRHEQAEQAEEPEDEASAEAGVDRRP